MRANNANEFLRMLDAKDYSYGAKYLFEERRDDRERFLKYLKDENYRPLRGYAVTDILKSYAQDQDEGRFVLLRGYFEGNPDTYREIILKSGVLERPAALRNKLKLRLNGRASDGEINIDKILRQLKKADGISNYCLRLDASNNQFKNAVGFLQIALNLPNTTVFDIQTAVQLYEKVKFNLPERRGYPRSDNDPDAMFSSSFVECVQYVDGEIWRLAGLRDEYLARDGAGVWSSRPKGRFFEIGRAFGWENAVKYLQGAFLMRSGAPKSGKYDDDTARFLYNLLKEKNSLPKEAWYFTSPVIALAAVGFESASLRDASNGLRYVDSAVWQGLGLDLRYFATDGDAVWKQALQDKSPADKYFEVTEYSRWTSAIKYMQRELKARNIMRIVPDSGRYDADMARFVYSLLGEKGDKPAAPVRFAWPSGKIVGAQTDTLQRVVDASVWERLGLDLRFFAPDGESVWETGPKNEHKPAPDHVYVTAEQLLAIGWTGVSASMVDDLNRVLEKYEINTPNRICHFLAQTYGETAAGEHEIEYNYGDEGYLKRQRYWPYVGAGNIHLTHKYEYQSFVMYLLLEEYPELKDKGAKYINGDNHSRQEVEAAYLKMIEIAKAEGIDTSEFTPIASFDENLFQIDADIDKYNFGAKYIADNFAWEAAGYYWCMHNINALADISFSAKEVYLGKINSGDKGNTKTFEMRQNVYDKLKNIIK